MHVQYNCAVFDSESLPRIAATFAGLLPAGPETKPWACDQLVMSRACGAQVQYQVVHLFCILTLYAYEHPGAL